MCLPTWSPMPSFEPTLFEPEPALVAGLDYRSDFLSQAEEVALLEHIRLLPFAPFEFHGYLGKRRVVSFGRRYDYGSRLLRDAPELPDFLLPLRARAATFAGVSEANIAHALVTEYSPGAGIGWHKDKSVFDKVVGVSLESASAIRLRRRTNASWQRASFIAEPRSAYLFAGPARTDWEHSIAPVAILRYSVTFRTVRAE
jgi:alkylated DNA repair dioxygenase AlkB